MASCDTAVHSEQYGPWRQHGLLTSIWIQAATQITNIHMAFGGYTDYGYQQRPQTTGPDFTLSDNNSSDINHRCLRWQCRLYTSICTPNPNGSMAHRHQHGLRLLVVAKASNINPIPGCIRTTSPQVALSGIMDHSGLSRRSNPGSESFLISGLHHCSEPGRPHRLGSIYRGMNLCLHNF